MSYEKYLTYQISNGYCQVDITELGSAGNYMSSQNKGLSY